MWKKHARGNNDAPSMTNYGSPVRLDAQIVALRPHCACTALRAPPLGTLKVVHKNEAFGLLVVTSRWLLLLLGRLWMVVVTSWWAVDGYK